MDRTDLLTADELERLGTAADHAELDRGELVRMNPPSFEHGRLAGLLTASLVAWVAPRRLGVVVVEAGFIVARGPDSVRAPDVAFVRDGRAGFPPPRAFATGAPDLAVEIATPDESPASLAAKAAEYLAAGGALVWVVDPVARSATEYRAGGTVRTVAGDDALHGAPALPGFRIPLRSLFGEP